MALLAAVVAFPRPAGLWALAHPVALLAAVVAELRLGALGHRVAELIAAVAPHHPTLPEWPLGGIFVAAVDAVDAVDSDIACAAQQTSVCGCGFDRGETVEVQQGRMKVCSPRRDL